MNQERTWHERRVFDHEAMLASRVNMTVYEPTIGTYITRSHAAEFLHVMITGKRAK